MCLTARSMLSCDGLFGIQCQSATIWGSLALWCWPAHSSCWRTRGVCWSSQEDRQEEGWCQVMTCLGCFFQDNQTGGMSHSLDPSVNSTSCDMWSPCNHRYHRFICLNERHVHQTLWYNKIILILKNIFPTVYSQSSCSFCLWMRPAALNPTVSSLVFPHRSRLSPHWWLKPKRFGPLSAEGSLGYQLSSIAQERHYSRAWYISEAQYCLGSWLQFSKHLVSEIWADTSKSGVVTWHMCVFSFNRRVHFDS